MKTVSLTRLPSFQLRPVEKSFRAFFYTSGKYSVCNLTGKVLVAVMKDRMLVPILSSLKKDGISSCFTKWKALQNAQKVLETGPKLP